MRCIPYTFWVNEGTCVAAVGNEASGLVVKYPAVKEETHPDQQRTKYAVERISEETMLDLAEMGQVTSNPRKEMVNKMEEPVKHQQQIKYKVGKIGGEMGPDLAEAGQVYKPAKDMEEKPVSYLTKAGKKARMRVQNEDTTTRIALVK